MSQNIYLPKKLLPKKKIASQGKSTSKKIPRELPPIKNYLPKKYLPKKLSPKQQSNNFPIGKRNLKLLCKIWQTRFIYCLLFLIYVQPDERLSQIGQWDPILVLF